MAKAESKTILKAYSTVESKLPTLPLEDGQLIFVYDKKKIILDNHGVRTVYEQIQTIETEEQRNDLLAPIDSFYFVIETSILWRYTNGHWNQITTSPQEQIDRIVAEGTKQVKAVQDKGTEVLQSIPEDFTTQMESKLDKNQGSENAGKALVIGEDGNVVPGEVASGGGDGIAIINTMSGESPLVIPDSAERVNKRLELGGKTDQVQTTGKNLFDPNNSYEDLVWIRNDGEIVGGSNVRTSDYIPVEQGNYTFQFDVINYNQMFVAGYNTDKQFVKIVGTISRGKCIIKIDNIEIETIRLSYTRESTRIQLERSETQTPYEPYTGGKSSPSPEYPQEIKNSGKRNEEKQKYEVDVKVTGKNLLNLQKEPDVKGIYQGWKVGNGELLTLGVKDNGNNADIKGCYIGFSDQGSESNGVVWVVDNGVIKVNSLNQRKAYVSIFPANETAVKKLTDRFDIQCELGNVATPYQPYKEQTLTLTSDRPLTKWDKLVEQDGQIGWLYQSAINEYRGDASVAIYQNGFCFLLNNKKLKSGEGYCEELKQYVSREEKPCINFNMSPNTYAYTLNTQAIYGSTTSAIKEYLKTHPLHLAYKTETTEFVPLPQSEQNAIRALKTYYPTTVITVDGGEVDSDIKATYTADTKNYIDGKVSANVASILRQYQADTVNLLSLMPMETQAAMIENDTNRILENVEEMKYE